MKTLTSLLIALIAFGASAIWYGSSGAAVENREPVHLAYPGLGLAVAEQFHLASGGRFALEIGTPATAEELVRLHREQPDVACNLDVTLVGPEQFMIKRHVTELHNGGWNDENLFFPLALFVLPSGGKYELTLKSNAVTDLFSKRGAVVRLERWEDVGSALGWAIEVWAGYISLACALVVALLLRLQPTALKPAA
ncbi:MAG TPA: hypothetical protein VN380_01515 [Thermoanaerobaculia bacterium]|jgi:hypothetical protein|nr:hypothetical protein [Thermoanaerobaculia bacterium]